MAAAGKILKTVAKKKSKKKKSTPTQEGLRFRKNYEVQEGAAFDPETGARVSSARKVGTKGEKVSKGLGPKQERGATAAGYRASKGRQARSKRKVQLEIKKNKGTITKKEATELRNLTTSMSKSDIKATARQEGKDIAGRQRRWEAAKKRKGKSKTSDADWMKQTGEIRTGYNPTIKEMEVAARNAQARGETSTVRRIKAILEEMRKKKPGETAIGGYRGSKGTTRSSEYSTKSGGGTQGTGKRGMRTHRYNKGGLVGMGAALRGGGAVRKRSY